MHLQFHMLQETLFSTVAILDRSILGLKYLDNSFNNFCFLGQIILHIESDYMV